MKKQMNPEVQAIQTQTINQAEKATIKKEEKKMKETKKAEATIPEFMKAYRQNEAGEFLMTPEMFDEFKAENPTLVFGTRKADKDVRLVKVNKAEKVATIIRFDVEAKKKQVHIHTGATKKVCSARNEADGMRYKVIFVQAKNRYELWSADNGGKRKKMAQGAEAEVMAQYEELIGKKVEKKATQTSKKATKKSA